MSNPYSGKNTILKSFFENPYRFIKQGSIRSAFFNTPTTDLIKAFDGWAVRSVNISLNASSKYVDLLVLQFGDIIFYKPIREEHYHEFEYFFGFGLNCKDFSTDRVRFMHVRNDISIMNPM